MMKCIHKKLFCKYTTFFRTLQLPALFLFLPSSATLLHRYTATFIAIACRENQYRKIKRKIIQTI